MGRSRFGGFIGAAIDPTRDDANGVWNLSDIFHNAVLSRWPFGKYIEVILIAGGAGGGSASFGNAGGGGAGGVVMKTLEAVPGSYTITIGGGGAGGSGYNVPGSPGSDTVAFDLIAVGGGHGAGGHNVPVGSGGSGGGHHSNTGSAIGGTGIVGQGNPGGGSFWSNGGGGYSVGGSGSSDDFYLYGTDPVTGKGGQGLNLGAIGFANPNSYVAGGGSGGRTPPIGAWVPATRSQTTKPAGFGGGGTGTTGGGSNASANTGAGGSGAGSPNGSSPGGNGGSGASGLVVIRYVDGTVTATGGTTQTYTWKNKTYKKHTFTTSGTFTIS